MKRLFGILIGLVLIAVPVVAFACHAYVKVASPSCEQVTSSYEFQGSGGSWYRGVASGDLASFTTAAVYGGAKQTGTIYNGAKPAGTYTQTFKMQGDMWYECNTGNWTWSGTSGSKCWCQGLSGHRVTRQSYDCGETWTYWYDGERTDGYRWLGFYPGEDLPDWGVLDGQGGCNVRPV